MISTFVNPFALMIISIVFTSMSNNHYWLNNVTDDKYSRHERLLKQRNTNMKREIASFVITQNIIFDALTNI